MSRLRLLHRGSRLRLPGETGLLHGFMLACALVLQCVWPGIEPDDRSGRTPLPPAPPAHVLQLSGLGDSLAVSYAISLWLQSFDDQAGARIGFGDLNYGLLSHWLSRAAELDPPGHYPHLLASHVYTQVRDPARQKAMIELVRAQAGHDLARRWQWLAHASLVARHRLGDTRLALALASDLVAAPASVGMPGWARQMAVFLHEDLGEHEAARVLLGGLLESGMVTDPAEVRFLLERLAALRDADRSALVSDRRRDRMRDAPASIR
ncbi:MAG: hypothetical protein IT532_04065 [Burkholderiales bacterium]|nr:hypothetical protein [Burkholderiales bacterium]